MNAKKASERDGALLIKAWLDSEAACRGESALRTAGSERAWLQALRHWIATRHNHNAVPNGAIPEGPGN
jgi:hypothetical protein